MRLRTLPLLTVLTVSACDIGPVPPAEDAGVTPDAPEIRVPSLDGAWHVAWYCVSACGLEQPPALVASSHLDVDGAAIGWRSETHAADNASESCLVVPTDGNRHGYLLCRRPAGAAAAFVSWYNPQTQRWQTWEARLTR